MGDLAEDFRAMTKYKTEKRADNTEKSTKLLKEYDINFVSKNNGAHLIVENKIDFWPSTGLFINRVSGKKGRGVWHIIKKFREGGKQ